MLSKVFSFQLSSENIHFLTLIFCKPSQLLSFFLKCKVSFNNANNRCAAYRMLDDLTSYIVVFAGKSFKFKLSEESYFECGASSSVSVMFLARPICLLKRALGSHSGVYGIKK